MPIEKNSHRWLKWLQKMTNVAIHVSFIKESDSIIEEEIEDRLLQRQEVIGSEIYVWS